MKTDNKTNNFVENTIISRAGECGVKGGLIFDWMSFGILDVNVDKPLQ